MTIRRKGAAPWSVDYEAGLADAPVSSHPGVEADLVSPVINAGFIDEKGNWQIDKIINDREFTFQDPNQALAAGAQISVEGINMLNHNILIFASKDTSGNTVPLSFTFNNNITGSGTPYQASEFEATGVQESVKWTVNEYPGGGGTSGALDEILESGNRSQFDTWQFFKVIGLRGTVGKVLITNEDSTNTGTISTAFLRIV